MISMKILCLFKERFFVTVHFSRYKFCAGVFNLLALACAWVISCYFGFNCPLRQYFSLYRAGAWVNGSSTAMIYMKRLCLFMERLFKTVHSSAYMFCACVFN